MWLINRILTDWNVLIQERTVDIFHEYSKKIKENQFHKFNELSLNFCQQKDYYCKLLA